MNEIEAWVGLMDRSSVSSWSPDKKFDDEVRQAALVAATPPRPLVKKGPNAKRYKLCKAK